MMAENQTFLRAQRIGIFVFEGFEPIDVWGFAEAFAIARSHPNFLISASLPPR
jgi:hypothetical protein